EKKCGDKKDYWLGANAGDALATKRGLSLLGTNLTAVLVSLLDDKTFEPFFRLRKLRVELLECLRQDLAYDQVAIPFTVRRDDVPRGMLRIAFGEGVFVSVLVVIPQLAFFQVTLIELPQLVGVVEACL